MWNKIKSLMEAGKNKKMSPIEGLKSKIKRLEKNTIHLIYNKNRDSFSKIGALPIVPPDFIWPVWNEKSLSFLMQLSFSEINPNGELPDFPTSGLMYVFYDQEQSTWGFDPKDKGSWRILFYPETNNLKELYRYPKDVKVRYSEKFLSPNVIKTRPSADSDEIGTFAFDDEQWDWYYDYIHEPFDEQPKHQLGGYPDPIQGNDMDLECQLASNGIYVGDESGYKTSQAKELAKNRSDWTLLMQIDTDDYAKMMWGDCGMLYFWIKKENLKNLNVENVWMILQCG